MDPIDVITRSLFRLEPVPDSPRLEDSDSGLRLAARELSFANGIFSLDLLLSYRFEPEIVASYHRFTEAVSIGLEDSDAGRASAFRALDPRKKYPERPEPNFVGIRTLSENATGQTGGSVVMPLAVSLPVPTTPGASFHATAFLEQHVSNTLAFDLSACTVESFLDGKPFDPPRESEGPTAAALPPRPPADAALVLTPRRAGGYAPGEPVHFEARLTLPLDELAALGAEAWLRSLFVWSTRQDSQGTRVGNWLRDRAALADDFRVVGTGSQGRAVALAPFELSQVVGAPFTPGVYFVQASARHYRSKVLELRCE